MKDYWKFRGLDKNNTWVYGNLVCYPDGSCYIAVPRTNKNDVSFVQVDPDSVCQCVSIDGLYEHDVIIDKENKNVIEVIAGFCVNDNTEIKGLQIIDYHRIGMRKDVFDRWFKKIGNTIEFQYKLDHEGRLIDKIPRKIENNISK